MIDPVARFFYDPSSFPTFFAIYVLLGLVGKMIYTGEIAWPIESAFL